MVFQTLALYVRSRGPDEFWRKRKIFKLAAHFLGRRRNTYGNAVQAVRRSLVFATQGRKLKKEDARELMEVRLQAACEEHHFSFPILKQSLERANILLNRKVLAELAAWEPRTFKSIVHLAWQNAKDENLDSLSEVGEPPEGVITRGMLVRK